MSTRYGGDLAQEPYFAARTDHPVMRSQPTAYRGTGIHTDRRTVRAARQQVSHYMRSAPVAAARVSLVPGCVVGQAAWGARWTMRSASRAAEIRSSRGMVGMTLPASRRDRAGWVIAARVASS